jgi:hypothetical protein
MSQFKGTYVFKQDGVEVGRSENIITDDGRKTILQYLSGYRNEWASDLAIGAISNPPLSTDTELNFETARVPITLKTFRSKTLTDPDLIVLRGTLPSTMYANIYEIGVYPESKNTDIANRNNRILTDFSDLSNWVASVADINNQVAMNGTVEITGFMPQAPQSPRIGGFSVEIYPNTSYYNNTYGFSLQGYSDIDTLKLLVYNTVAGNATVTMTDANNQTLTFNYVLSDNAGYSILSAPFPSGVQYLSTIKSINITTDSTGVLTLDAIKASTTRELTSTEYIISKSVLYNPIAKMYGITLDVEYYLQLL